MVYLTGKPGFLFTGENPGIFYSDRDFFLLCTENILIDILLCSAFSMTKTHKALKLFIQILEKKVLTLYSYVKNSAVYHF